MSASVKAAPNAAQLRKLQKKLAEEEIFKKPVAQMIHDASDFAVAEAQSNAQPLGGIPGTIHAEVRGWQAAVVSRHAGVRIMEVGRKPLAAGGKWAPPQAFSRYPEQDRFAIAAAVARRGIKGRFFMRRARAKLQQSEFGRLMKLCKKAIREGWLAP